jgi:hypothetical protein
MVNRELLNAPVDTKRLLMDYWGPISQRSLAKLNDSHNFHKPKDALQVAFYELLKGDFFEKVDVDWTAVPSGLSAPYPSGLFNYALTGIGVDLEHLYTIESPDAWLSLVIKNESTERFRELISANFSRPSSATNPGRYEVIPPLVTVLLPDQGSVSIVDLGGSIGAGLPYSEIAQEKWDKLEFQGKGLVPGLFPYRINNGVIVDKIDSSSNGTVRWVECCVWPGKGSIKVLDEIRQGVLRLKDSDHFKTLQADLSEKEKILQKNSGQLYDVATTFFLRYILPSSLQIDFEQVIRNFVRPGGIWISEGDGLLKGRTSAPWDVQAYRVRLDGIEHLGNPFDLTPDQQRIGLAKSNFWNNYI